MASRSTRNKLRHQLDKAINDCVRIQSHLHILDELARGESQVVTATLPVAVESVEAVSDFLIAFRSDL